MSQLPALAAWHGIPIHIVYIANEQHWKKKKNKYIYNRNFYICVFFISANSFIHCCLRPSRSTENQNSRLRIRIKKKHSCEYIPRQVFDSCVQKFLFRAPRSTKCSGMKNKKSGNEYSRNIIIKEQRKERSEQETKSQLNSSHAIEYCESLFGRWTYRFRNHSATDRIVNMAILRNDRLLLFSRLFCRNCTQNRASSTRTQTLIHKIFYGLLLSTFVFLCFLFHSILRHSDHVYAIIIIIIIILPYIERMDNNVTSKNSEQYY